MNTSTTATERIRNLSQVVPHYANSGEDDCLVRDLLTDLHHFCEQAGLDLYEILDDSRTIYTEEKA